MTDLDTSHDELLRRWQEWGDREALDQLLRIEIGELKRRLALKGRLAGLRVSAATVSGVAVDAAADVTKAQRPITFRHTEAFRAYLLVAAWHLLLRYVRSRHARHEEDLTDAIEMQAIAKGSSVSTAAERLEEAEIVRFALALVDRVSRDVLERHYLHHQTVPQMARDLGLGEKAIEKRLKTAKDRLRPKLAAWKGAFSSV